jgi:hypothetical protein
MSLTTLLLLDSSKCDFMRCIPCVIAGMTFQPPSAQAGLISFESGSAVRRRLGGHHEVGTLAGITAVAQAAVILLQ